MVGIEFKFCWHNLEQPLLYFIHIFSRRKASAIGDPKDMGIYRYGGPAKCGVEHHIGRFATNAWQRLQCLPALGNFTAMQIQELLTALDDVLCLGIVKAYGFDMVLQPLNSQLQKLGRCVGYRKQGRGGLVDADIRGLRREDDSDQ